MSLCTIIIREIVYRKFHFLASVLVVFLATACVSSVFTLLRAHTICMNVINNDQTISAEKAMADLHEDYRLITRDMGYNVLILARNQDVTAFLSEGVVSTPLPESSVNRLVQSSLTTLQHLLPALLIKTEWPDPTGPRIFLCGIRSEVEHQKSNKKDPMMEPVPLGTVRVGYLLAQRHALASGGPLTCMGRTFVITEILEERGSNEDITLWFNLDELQAMTGRKDEISMIYALSCTCTGSELERIRKEIGAILPETQIIQLAAQATARAQTRQRAKSLDSATMEQLSIHHGQLASEREALAGWLLPAVVTAAMAILAYLSWSNANARTSEIGLWRALGMKTGRLMTMLLAKAILTGCMGAGMGVVSGIAVGCAWGLGETDGICSSLSPKLLINPLMALTVLLSAPALAFLAAWLPALVASRKDPASILRED